jgi:hypothetical protein
MLCAQRLTGLQLIAETLTQYADDRLDAFLVAKAGLKVAETHVHFSGQWCLRFICQMLAASA